MKATVYPYQYRFSCADHTLLWTTSERDNEDQFLLDECGQLYKAASLADAKTKFRELDLEIAWDEGCAVDFDEFWRHLEYLRLNRNANDYELLLNGWNFIEDVLRTFHLTKVRATLDSPTSNSSYDKIFRCSNAADIPEARSDYPNWAQSEVESLVRDLKYAWTSIDMAVPDLW